jgi:ribosomal protein S18 acetylase RimI-like enzyme
MKKNKIKIIDYQQGHQPFFEQLYRSWFQKHFRTEPEPVDKFVLTDPEKAILQRGGVILIGVLNDETAGTVALKKINDWTFELTKMAVDENHRRKGVGEALTGAAIQKARSLGANRIVLYSHSSLGPALHMYRKFGFREIPLEKGLYSSFRCDIKMEMFIDTITMIKVDGQLAPVKKRSLDHSSSSMFSYGND